MPAPSRGWVSGLSRMSRRLPRSAMLIYLSDICKSIVFDEGRMHSKKIAFMY